MEKAEALLEVKRFDNLKAWRKNWETDWEHIALMMMPWRADFITQRSPGDRHRYRHQYDGTAPNAIDVLSGHMHTNLTSPSMQWFQMEYREDDMNGDDEAKEWLEDCTDRMLGAINDSNFVVSIAESYEDLIAFGTCCIESGYTMSDTGAFSLSFRLHPLNTVCIAEDHNGLVDTVYIERQLTARQAKAKWPDVVIDKVEQALERSPDRKFTFLRCVKPNEKHDPTSDAPDARPYVAYWIYKAEMQPIETEYFYELIFHVPRWKTSTAEVWGHGLGIKALPDVLTLNEAKRLALRGWEKAIDPPLMGEADGVIGDLHLEAGGYTMVRDTKSLAPLSDATNWQAHMLNVEDTRSSIQSVFFIDQLIVPERPNQTATEVTIRYEMMQKMLGSTMGRLKSELLDPLIQRVFNMMYRAGQFEEPPAIVQEMGGQDVIDVNYVGPLARSQQTDEAVAVERLIGSLASMAQVFPEMMDILDPTGAAKVLADRYGTPAKALRGDDEIEQIRAERQQQMQQMQAMQSAQMAGAAAESQTAAIENRQLAEQELVGAEQ